MTHLPVLAEVALLLLALPVLVASSYLGFLALRSAPPVPPQAPRPPKLAFDIVVPAHNEALGIASTVTNLLRVVYPHALRRVVVVADNCTDDTAERARQAGALVLERQDATKRGKGYALEHAFTRCRADGFADAVVVVDADTQVSPNLLEAFSARLANGASAAQAHYGVLNPGASWRTRLMTIALAMFHQVRSIGREKLGVSCGLRGNGMCFRLSLLKKVPHDAYSLVEDLEYGIRLGRAGERVHYVWEAEVLGEMVSGEQASRSQRHRWEHGRAQMVRQHGWPLLRDGLNRGSALLLDLAMDVLIPPLSRVVGLAVFGLLASAAAAYFWSVSALPLTLFALSAAGLGVYVAAGWWHSGTGLRGLADLAMAPAYIAWKVLLVVRGQPGKKKDEWVRTTREGESS